MSVHSLTSFALLTLLFSCFSVAQEQQSDEDEWAMDEWQEWPEEESSTAHQFNGFIELALGNRLQSDGVIGRSATLRDVRGQLQWDWRLPTSNVAMTTDVYYDGVLETMKLQVRELAWQGRLGALGDWGENFDLKVGQQVLTWGTGDYVFLNDLFPKDYQSFFSGREDEYLKAPSLSAKLSGYFDWANIDLVITPQFTPDNYINGEYFSFFSPAAGGNIAPEFEVIDENQPDNAELAMRVYRSFGASELAFYAYRGHHKTPVSADALGRPLFSRLNAFGASLITPMASGLLKAEYALHDSVEDSHGTLANIANSQSRFLLGYEQELVANLTGSVQWYLEHTHDYAGQQHASPWPQYEQARNRHFISTQLMYRALRQTLTVNWFNFYSPSDSDGYMRLRVSYSPVDTWRASVGTNWFYGSQQHSFFNQFNDASNVYAAYRYYF